MKRTITALALAASLASLNTGCANMTPEERENAAAAFGAVLGGVAAGAGAYANARYSQPVYIAPAPVYIAPRRTICRNSWGSVVCDSY